MAANEDELATFDQNLLIPLDLSRLRQIVIKLVSRLLTEMLEVRILPGEPTPLGPAVSYGTFRRNLFFHEETSTARMTINGD